jgi:uncharacterized protein (TIGR01244 family)
MLAAERSAALVHVRDVTDDFAVAAQVRPEDVSALAARFSLLINNRPDGEAPDQPSSAEIESAAGAAGMDYLFVPVTGAPDVEQVEVVQAALRRSEGPALAFCRTGTRSIVVWALGEALDGRPQDELRRLGAQAGYDLAGPLQTLLGGLSR